VPRRATAIRADVVRHRTIPDMLPFPSDLGFEGNPMLPDATHLIPIARLVSQIAVRPLLPESRTSQRSLLQGVSIKKGFTPSKKGS
jgi:hypothetical protein